VGSPGYLSAGSTLGLDALRRWYVLAVEAGRCNRRARSAGCSTGFDGINSAKV
jgi:hypothetical protein